MVFLLQALWVSSNLTLLACIAALFWRKRQTRLPVFTGYLFLLILEFCVLFTIALRQPFPQRIYHWATSVSLCADTIWTLGVIYELTDKLWLVRRGSARFSRLILQAVLAVLVIVSAAGAGSLSDWSAYQITNISERLEFSSNVILAGMFLAMVILRRYLRLSWRNWVAGIVLGFGISASVSLAAAASLAAFGKGALKITDIVKLAGFQACTFIWLIYLVLPEGPTTPPVGGLRRQDLERWNEEVEKIVPQ